jgi:DNA-binding transcriptional ArsR family regulator
MRAPVKAPLTVKERATVEIAAALDSDFFRALAEPTRIEILKLLVLQGAADINTIASQLPQDRSVLSRHLQTLLHADIVSCTKEGRRRVYSIRGGALIQRLEAMVSSVKALITICCPEQLG